MSERPPTPQRLFLEARTIAGRLGCGHPADLGRRADVERFEVALKALEESLRAVALGDGANISEEE